MQRYNFDHYKNNQLMAEGIAVHAETLEDATKQANQMLVQYYDDRELFTLRTFKNKREMISSVHRLEFRDNRQCITQCRYCKV